jgi:hypothetical protein
MTASTSTTTTEEEEITKLALPPGQFVELLDELMQLIRYVTDACLMQKEGEGASQDSQDDYERIMNIKDYLTRSVKNKGPWQNKPTEWELGIAKSQRMWDLVAAGAETEEDDNGE